MFNRVQDMYMKAARLQPSVDLDPDVQTGLGVLLNLSGEFERVKFVLFTKLLQYFLKLIYRC